MRASIHSSSRVLKAPCSGKQTISACEHKKMPKSLQIDTFQLVRGNHPPYPRLIFWDNIPFPAQVIPLALSCQCWMGFKARLLRMWKWTGLCAAPYKGAHRWKAHSAFFSPWRGKSPTADRVSDVTALTHQTGVVEPQPGLHRRWGGHRLRRCSGLDTEAARADQPQLSQQASALCAPWASTAATAQGLGFASASITLCNILRHDQVIPRDTQFIC